MKWKFIIFIDLDGLGCIETPGDAALKHEIFIQHLKAWILCINNFDLKTFFLFLNDGQITSSWYVRPILEPHQTGYF